MEHKPTVAELTNVLKAVERELTDPDVADKDIREATLRIVREGLTPRHRTRFPQTPGEPP